MSNPTEPIYNRMKTQNKTPMSSRPSVLTLNMTQQEVIEASEYSITDRYTVLDVLDLITRFLIINHPGVIQLRNSSGINLVSGFQFNTETSVIVATVDFSSSELLRKDEPAETVSSCPCGLSVSIRSSVNTETGEVSVLLNLDDKCQHRFLITQTSTPKLNTPKTKPPSKKRRQRDARQSEA